MDYKALLAKMGKGEALTAEELLFVQTQMAKNAEDAKTAEADGKKALEDQITALKKAEAERIAEQELADAGDKGGKPSGDTVPRSRLNEETSKRKEFEKQLSIMQTEIKEFKDRDLSEQERKDNATAEQITALTTERDTLLKQSTEFEATAKTASYNLSVHKLAGSNVTKHRFKSPEFLGMQLVNAGISIDDKAATDAFMEKTLTELPEMFTTTVKAGAGAVPAGVDGASTSAKKIVDMNDQEKVAHHKEVGRDTYDAQVRAEITAK